GPAGVRLATAPNRSGAELGAGPGGGRTGRGPVRGSRAVPELSRHGPRHDGALPAGPRGAGGAAEHVLGAARAGAAAALRAPPAHVRVAARVLRARADLGRFLGRDGQARARAVRLLPRLPLPAGPARRPAAVA